MMIMFFFLFQVKRDSKIFVLCSHMNVLRSSVVLPTQIVHSCACVRGVS